MKRNRLYDKAVEATVVGSAMIDRASFEALAKIITKAEMFYYAAHQCCWRAFYRMHREGLAFEPQSLYMALVKDNTLADVRKDYIVDLVEARSSALPSHQAQEVAELYVRRKGKAEAERLADELLDPASRPAEVWAEARQRLDSLAAEVAGAHGDDDDDGQAAGYVPFPTGYLPDCLKEYVSASAAALHCDPAYIAVPALVSIGAAIGNSRVIQIKESWREPSIFWAAVIADPSSMKSPSFDLATAPLWELQDTMSKQFEHDWRRYQEEIEEWNSTRWKKAKKSDDPSEDKKPSKPVPKKIIVSDITIEKLARVLLDNPHGVVLCREELSGWFSSFGRYSDGKGVGADMSLWLQLYGARSLVVDRQGGDPPSFCVRRASCSVMGTIQPAIMARQLTDEFFESGLVARLLPCMPPKRPKEWTEAVVPEAVYRQYAEAVKEIYRTGQEIFDWGDGEPLRIGFSPKGKEAWIEFYRHWAKRQSDADGEFVSALAKLEAYCARFCLLLAVAEKLDSPSNRDAVKASHVEAAFGIVEWFAAEAQRVYARLRTPAEAQARDRLTETIRQRGGSITPNDLRKMNKRRYPTNAEAQQALDELAAHGVGEWVFKPASETGGRPMRALRLVATRTNGHHKPPEGGSGGF